MDWFDRPHGCQQLAEPRTLTLWPRPPFVLILAGRDDKWDGLTTRPTSMYLMLRLIWRTPAVRRNWV